jgi:hypothetical protein
MVNFNTVITSLSALQTQQDLLSSTQGAVANNLVRVYKPLGGGLEIRQGKDRPINKCRSRTRKSSGHAGFPRSLATPATRKRDRYLLANPKTVDELLPESIKQEMPQRTKYWKKLLEE